MRAVDNIDHCERVTVKGIQEASRLLGGRPVFNGR